VDGEHWRDRRVWRSGAPGRRRALDGVRRRPEGPALPRRARRRLGPRAPARRWRGRELPAAHGEEPDMVGLHCEHIGIVGIIAAIVLGPSRLPHYAQKLGELARLLRAQIDVARDNASESLGVEDWQSLDPHQYDPRRIIREALHEPARDSKQETGSTGA